MNRKLVVLLLLFFSVSCSASEIKTVVISRDSKPLAVLKVEVASTPTERARGLMFRKDLPDDRGMWFVFDEDVSGSFWMENTYISLDIVFIDKDNKIVSVAKNAVPLSREHIYPAGPYRYVLEVNSGISDKYGFTSGDDVVLK